MCVYIWHCNIILICFTEIDGERASIDVRYRMFTLSFHLFEQKKSTNNPLVIHPLVDYRCTDLPKLFGLAPFSAGHCMAPLAV